jgi:hypothetical protein
VSAARVRDAHRARRVHRACVARAAVSRAPVVRGRGPFERKSGRSDVEVRRAEGGGSWGRPARGALVERRAHVNHKSKARCEHRAGQ